MTDRPPPARYASSDELRTSDALRILLVARTSGTVRLSRSGDPPSFVRKLLTPPLLVRHSHPRLYTTAPVGFRVESYHGSGRRTGIRSTALYRHPGFQLNAKDVAHRATPSGRVPARRQDSSALDRRLVRRSTPTLRSVTATGHRSPYIQAGASNGSTIAPPDASSGAPGSGALKCLRGFGWNTTDDRRRVGCAGDRTDRVRRG